MAKQQFIDFPRFDAFMMEGQSLWPRLTEPDQFNEADTPKYQTTLVVPAAQAAPFIKRFEEALTEALSMADRQVTKGVQPFNPPWEDEVDEEGKPTGNIRFRFKRRADWGTRPLFGPDANVWDTDTEGPVRSGYMLAVRARPKAWYMASTRSVGISLVMEAVQVTERAAPSADTFGFSAVEEPAEAYD